jgi:hypothetical protein
LIISSTAGCIIRTAIIATITGRSRQPERSVARGCRLSLSWGRGSAARAAQYDVVSGEVDPEAVGDSVDRLL